MMPMMKDTDTVKPLERESGPLMSTCGKAFTSLVRQALGAFHANSMDWSGADSSTYLTFGESTLPKIKQNHDASDSTSHGACRVSDENTRRDAGTKKATSAETVEETKRRRREHAKEQRPASRHPYDLRKRPFSGRVSKQTRKDDLGCQSALDSLPSAVPSGHVGEFPSNTNLELTDDSVGSATATIPEDRGQVEGRVHVDVANIKEQELRNSAESTAKRLARVQQELDAMRAERDTAVAQVSRAWRVIVNQRFEISSLKSQLEREKDRADILEADATKLVEWLGELGVPLMRISQSDRDGTTVAACPPAIVTADIDILEPPVPGPAANGEACPAKEA